MTDIASSTENQAPSLVERAERLWAELQENNLGGFSGINRPFWIVQAFKDVRRAHLRELAAYLREMPFDLWEVISGIGEDAEAIIDALADHLEKEAGG